VVALLKQHYAVEVTEQAVDYYRGAYADQIGAAREEALQRAAQQGFANKVRALGALSRKALKLDEVLDASPVSTKNWGPLCAELRALRRDIRDELGDLVERREVLQRPSELAGFSEEELDELLAAAEAEGDGDD